MSNAQNLISDLLLGFKMARRAARFKGADLSELEYWKQVFEDAHAEYKHSWDLYRRLGQSWDYVRVEHFLESHSVVHRRYAAILKYCHQNIPGIDWHQLENELDSAFWVKTLESDVAVIITTDL